MSYFEDKPLAPRSDKNEFNLLERPLSEIEIRESSNKENCKIWDSKDPWITYNSFVLAQNSKSKIICELSFYRSSKTKKYIPRPVFKRISLAGEIQSSNAKNKSIVSLQKSEDARQFWKLISFLNSYKSIVDLEEFEKSFQVIEKDFFSKFKDLKSDEKISNLIQLIKIANLSSSDIKVLTLESRKQNLKAFYLLLKNSIISQTSKTAHETYRDKYNLGKGEECIWHHFLKNNDWILGLNADLKFIYDFLDEQKVGTSTSKGRQDPQTDLLGISEFTVLVELKHSSTNIFKKEKSKGRANTWDFTSDFIEGISQCLGQKLEFEKSFDRKDFEKSDGTILDKKKTLTVDPKSILVIGDKKREFPIDEMKANNLIKIKTFERFRRNNRNIEVITFDELFERAYHIVYSTKLKNDWYIAGISES